MMFGGTPQSSVVQTADEMRKAYEQKLAAAQGNNAAGQQLYNQMLGTGLDPHIVDTALGGAAAQFGGGRPDAMSDIWNNIRPEMLSGIASQAGGGTWDALQGWSPVDTGAMQSGFDKQMAAFGDNQKRQNQAYSMMQGGGFNGGVLSGGSQTSMFGTPLAGGLGGLGGYNPSGGFGMPGATESNKSYGDAWGAFGQPQGAQSGGLGGPFSSVKNPWSFS